LHFDYAGFWIRGVALTIDGILLQIMLWPVGVGLKSLMLSPILILPLSTLINMTIGASYSIFFVTKLNATPGKLLFGKKIVTATGEPLSLKHATTRHFATILSSLSMGIGYLMAAFDEEHRALHDRICNTRVVAK
jgi:uncharacterized RDD family membrane protein YckC